MRQSDFERKTGKINIPTAERIRVNRDPWQNASIQRHDFEQWKPGEKVQLHPYRFCHTVLREGCYRISVTSPYSYVFGNTKQGTIRVERVEGDVCISGDLYKAKSPVFQGRIPVLNRDVTRVLEAGRLFKKDIRLLKDNMYVEAKHSGYLHKLRSIPVYPRNRYYAYLDGTSAFLNSIVRVDEPCRFSLDFDLYEYEHPADGFDGTFPNAPTTHVRLALEHTETNDRYTGTLYDGDTELGNVVMQWVSSSFRKAYLSVHTLEDAVAPQPVAAPDGTGGENFRTIFASAGWDLSVTYHTPDLTLPDTLDGVQDPEECWSRQNLHELLESAEDYDPAALDRKWLVHLLAVPGKLGCSRGKMFDNNLNAADPGDVNFVAREGAATYCDDGYNNPAFGAFEDELQHDVPRAFIRSAAHEIGHAFNQIHQWYEDGIDNSIMTVSPGVAEVLNDAGLDFPDDIALSFNETVRHHLIHLPDPAVRPGTISFFGNLIVSPEADDIIFIDPTVLELKIVPGRQRVKLGEPLRLEWNLTNRSAGTVIVPELLTDRSLVSRVSVTYPDGSIRYIRPQQIEADLHIPLTDLKPKEIRKADTMLFWNKEGFVFENPGRHAIEVVLLWQTGNGYVGTRSSVEVWVDYPVTLHENEVAALLLHKEVGKFVAVGGRVVLKEAVTRIEKVITTYKTHPACDLLRDIPGHRFSRIKLPKKKKTTKKKKKTPKKKIATTQRMTTKRKTKILIKRR